MTKISTVKGEYIAEMLKHGAREANRGLMDYRKISITPNMLPNAEGSAQVEIGNTKILAGVKVSLDEPLKDKPDEGSLVVSAELLPLASPHYEPGPPSPEAIEYARVVDRGIRAANVLDTKALFIEKDKVWTAFVDLYVLNYDGNLFDAGTLAAMVALSTAKQPKYEDEKVIRTGNLSRMKINSLITSCTFAKSGSNILIDPDGTEESVMDARVTIANDEKNVNAMQKGLSGAFTMDEIDQLIEKTFEKSKDLRSAVKKAIGE